MLKPHNLSEDELLHEVYLIGAPATKELLRLYDELNEINIDNLEMAGRLLDVAKWARDFITPYFPDDIQQKTLLSKLNEVIGEWDDE